MRLVVGVGFALLVAGCLDVPGRVAGDDAGAIDGGDGAIDAATDGPIDPGACAFELDFDRPADLEGWPQEQEGTCACDVRDDMARFVSTSAEACTCRFRSPAGRGLGLGDRSVAIQLADPGGLAVNLAAVFSIELPGRVVSFTRDGADLNFGDCTEETCDTASIGAAPFSPSVNGWWRFTYHPGAAKLSFDVSGDGVTWLVQGEATEVAPLAAAEARVAFGASDFGKVGAFGFDDLSACPTMMDAAAR